MNRKRRCLVKHHIAACQHRNPCVIELLKLSRYASNAGLKMPDRERLWRRSGCPYPHPPRSSAFVCSYKYVYAVIVGVHAIPFSPSGAPAPLLRFRARSCQILRQYISESTAAYPNEPRSSPLAVRLIHRCIQLFLGKFRNIAAVARQDLDPVSSRAQLSSDSGAHAPRLSASTPS